MKKFEGYEHGVNFGGWLSQCDHTKERYDTFITEADFENVSKRFDHVRIPTDYDLFLNDDYSFNEEGLKYIDFAIAMCRKYGLNMILDLHRTPGYSFDPAHGEMGFFDSEEYQNVFYKIWREFARRYGKEKDMLTFELLNEVTDKAFCDKWNEISVNCIKMIRETAKDIRIIVGGYYNNSLEAIKDLAMPYDDNIIYTFHCYEPLLFTHQGAHWIPTMDVYFRCDYKMPYWKYDELSKIHTKDAYRAFPPFDKDDCPDERYFEYLLKEAIEVAKERNVALYCGEYGVIDRANKKEAGRWFHDFHAVMDKYNIGRCVWNYKQMDFEISEDFKN